MKKIVSFLLIICLLLTVAAGCGKKAPEPSPADAPTQTPAPGEAPTEGSDAGTDVPVIPTGTLIEDKYFSLNEEAGWIFYSRSGYLTLKHGDPDSKTKMEIHSATLVTVQEELDQALKNEGAVQGANVTYAGIEYLMIERVDRGETILITEAAKPVKDGDKTWDLVLTIELAGAALEQAAPVLESLKINAEVFEFKYEWPENDPVENDHFSYTATGGWYLYDKYDEPYSASMPGRLKSDEFFPSAYMEISWSFTDPESVIDTINFAFSSSVKRDDVVIAGVTYTVYADEPGLGDTAAANTFLVAPIESGGTIKIRIQSVGAEGAMPVLQTIKLK